MPKIEKLYTLEITPERFLEACSPTELWEVQMLLSSNRFQQKINSEPEPSTEKPLKLQP